MVMAATTSRWINKRVSDVAGIKCYPPEWQICLLLGTGKVEASAAGDCVTETCGNCRLGAQLMMFTVDGIAVAHLVIRAIAVGLQKKPPENRELVKQALAAPN